MGISDLLHWNVLDELFDSDHYPIILTYLTEENTEPIRRFKTNKAKWKEFMFKTEEIGDYE